MLIIAIIGLIFFLAVVAILTASTMLAVVVLAGTLVLLRFRQTRLAGAVTAIAAVTGGAAVAAAYLVLPVVFEYEIRPELTVVWGVIGFAWSGLAAGLLSGGATLAVAGVRRLLANAAAA
jgi:hypothetical protein